MHELSVIMPVYKEPVDVLQQSVDSVLKQTYKNFEFVIVTEPNESNVSFFESIQKSDSRVKVIRNETRLGVAGTRNRAINECSGEYISFADADDYSDPKRFEKQLNFLKNNPKVSVVGSNMHLVDEKNNIVGERRYPELYNDIKRDFLLTMPLANPTVMVRNEDFKEIGLFNRGLVKAEDLELWLRFLARNKRMHNLQENLLYYRIPSNEKRPKIHWANNYDARKCFAKHIWPWHQRLISLSAYFLITHIPFTLLNSILHLKVANKIKKIKMY